MSEHFILYLAAMVKTTSLNKWAPIGRVNITKTPADIRRAKRKAYNAKYRASEKGQAAEARALVKRKLARAASKRPTCATLAEAYAEAQIANIDLNMKIEEEEQAKQRQFAKDCDDAYEAESGEDFYWTPPSSPVVTPEGSQQDGDSIEEQPSPVY